jgi:uncharacterized membrane protein
MKPSSFPFIIVVLIAIAPLVYLAAIWQSIPDIVPIHFNSRMQPDRMASKSQLWFVAILMAGVSLGSYLLLKNIHKIDPKRVGKSSPAGFARLGMVIVVFISILNLVIIIASSSPSHAPLKLMPSLISLLFAFTGNYMSSIKPNYFAGIRLPWTLNSESNWKKTHQLAGKLWFWGGLIMAVVCLFIPEQAGIPTLLATMLVLTVIPAVYSFYLFTKEKNTQS